MIKVIINADDLGKSLEVNNQIGFALSNGYITSSTILANSQFWPEIHKIVDGNPQASFGVHLNLSDGDALTNNEIFKKYGIVDDSNKFTRVILKLVKKDNIPDDLLEAIYAEWDRQIDKVINEENIKITHLDGHHHIHQNYQLSDILYRLIFKYNIKIIRRKYSYPTKQSISLFSKILEKITTERVYCWVKRSRIKNNFISLLQKYMETILWQRKFVEFYISDYFDSYEHFVSQLKVGYKSPNNIVVELMCHPGHKKYEEEYQMIRSKILQKYLPDATLISYRNMNVE